MTEREEWRFEEENYATTSATDAGDAAGRGAEEGGDCECFEFGPPVALMRFLPPPPSPPNSLRAARCALDADDDSAPGGKIEHFCDVRVLQGQGQGPYTQAVIPSLAVILVCTLLFLALLFVAVILLWKHKRRMRNFLPCKTSPQDRCDLGSGNSVLYEDLTNIRPRTVPNHCPPETTVAPIEDDMLLDAKCNNYGGACLGSLGGNAVFIRPPKEGPPRYPRISLRARSEARREHCNPAYDEVSVASDCKIGESASSSTASEDGDREEEDDEDDDDDDEDDDDSPTATPIVASEDEFAEDELSLGELPRPEIIPRYSSLTKVGDLQTVPSTVTRVPVPSFATLQRNGDGPYRHVARDSVRSKCNGGGGGSGTSSLQGSTGGDLCVDFDSASRSRSGSTSSSAEVSVPGIVDRDRGKCRGAAVRRLPPPPHVPSQCVPVKGRNRRRRHAHRSQDRCVNGTTSKEEDEDGTWRNESMDPSRHLGYRPPPPGVGIGVAVISEPNQKVAVCAQNPFGIGPRHDRARNEFSTFHPSRNIVPRTPDSPGPLVHKHRRRKATNDVVVTPTDQYDYGFARA